MFQWVRRAAYGGSFIGAGGTRIAPTDRQHVHVNHKRHLEGAGAGDQGLVVDGVLHGAQPVAEGVLDLFFGVCFVCLWGGGWCVDLRFS